MSIATEIERLQNAKASIKASIENKGVVVGDVTIDNYATKIDEISSGGLDYKITNWRHLFSQNSRDISLLSICDDPITLMYAFDNNTEITTLDLRGFDFSKTTTLASAWNLCTKLKEIITDDGINCINSTDFYYVCYGAINLEKFVIKFNPSKITRTSRAFYNANKLATLVLDGDGVFLMEKTDVLYGTPISQGTGYVYVPDDLVDSYKSATNWSTYANQIKPLSEYIGG